MSQLFYSNVPKIYEDDLPDPDAKSAELDELVGRINTEATTSKLVIPIIGSGGTFQSAETDKGIAPSGSLDESMDALAIPRQTLEQFRLDTFELFNVDSSQMTAWHWQQLARTIIYIEQNTNSKINGIIAPHGTDTMNDAGAYLSFMLGQGLPFLTTITGSQQPARKESSDATQNMTRCLQAHILANKERLNHIAEVGIICGPTLERSTRAIKVSDHSPVAYRSFDDSPLINFAEDADYKQLRFAKNARKGNPGIPFTPFTNLNGDFSEVREVSMRGVSQFGFKEQIVSSRAAVVTLMGSGTAPNTHSDVITDLHAQGKVIVLRSPFPDSQTSVGTYEAGSSLARAQIPYINGTPEAIKAKLHFLMSRFEIKPKKNKNSDEFGLLVDPKKRALLDEQMCMSYVGEW